MGRVKFDVRLFSTSRAFVQYSPRHGTLDAFDTASGAECAEDGIEERVATIEQHRGLQGGHARRDGHSRQQILRKYDRNHVETPLGRLRPSQSIPALPPPTPHRCVPTTLQSSTDAFPARLGRFQRFSSHSRMAFLDQPHPRRITRHRSHRHRLPSEMANSTLVFLSPTPEKKMQTQYRPKTDWSTRTASPREPHRNERSLQALLHRQTQDLSLGTQSRQSVVKERVLIAVYHPLRRHHSRPRPITARYSSRERTLTPRFGQENSKLHVALLSRATTRNFGDSAPGSTAWRQMTAGLTTTALARFQSPPLTRDSTSRKARNLVEEWRVDVHGDSGDCAGVEDVREEDCGVGKPGTVLLGGEESVSNFANLVTTSLCTFSPLPHCTAMRSPY